MSYHPRRPHHPRKSGLNKPSRRASTRRHAASVHGAHLSRKGKKHPHKGSHKPHRPFHQSAAARAARKGKKHPHKGYHGHRKHHHISAAALARRIGKKHPHRGHPMSAAARAKLSASLRAYYAAHPKGKK